MSSAFSRQPPPPRKRLELAADAFVTGAEAAAITPASVSPSSAPSTTPVEEPLDGGSQTVRFTKREKAALQRLARAQRRSEHFIIKDLLSPALLRAASELDG